MRCWVFVNERTNTSHQYCDDDAGNTIANETAVLDR